MSLQPNHCWISGYFKNSYNNPIWNFGIFVYSFQLVNAAQTSQRFIDMVTWGLPFVYAYIDDLHMTSSFGDENELPAFSTFVWIPDYYQPYQMQLWSFVSSFSQTHWRWGWYLSTPPDKIRSIVRFSQPSSLWKLCEFLGLVNFYGRFIVQR